MQKLTADCFHVLVRLLTVLFFYVLFYLMDALLLLIIIINYFLPYLHIFIYSFLFLHFALEFARCPYKILQINYVDLDIDAWTIGSTPHVLCFTLASGYPVLTSVHCENRAFPDLSPVVSQSPINIHKRSAVKGTHHPFTSWYGLVQ